MSVVKESPSKTEVAGRQVLLTELRVFELKQELEKRSLDKNGIKLALVERLETALREEGHDPLTFEFTISDYGKAVTPSKAAGAQPATESKEEPTPAANGDSAGKTEQKEESAEKKANHSGNSSMGDDRALLIDDGDGEKPMIELDDEEGKNDVDTEDLAEEAEPEIDHEVDADIEMQPDLDIEPEQNGAKAPLEGAMEVESAKPNDEDKKPEETTEPVEVQSDETKKEDEEMGEEQTEKEDKENAEKPEGADGEEKAEEHVNEETKKAKTQPKPVTTIKKTSNSLWIKGLGSETKAADLKAMFAKCGRVVTAKIFTRRQQPSSTCFGYVTMVDTCAAEECIRVFNKTHINGHQVTVERADHSSMPTVKSGQKKSTATASTASSSASKSKETAKNGEKAGEKRKSEGKSTEKTEKKDAKGTEDSSKTVSSTKPGTKSKKPVEAPKTGSEKVRSSREASSAGKRSPPVFRRGRRVTDDNHDASLHRTLRGGVASHRAGRISTMARYGTGSYRGTFMSLRARGRAGRMMILPTRGHPIVSASAAMGRFGERSRLMGIPSRHRSPPRMGGMYDSPSSYRDSMARRPHGDPDWERREMMHIMRRREEEFRLKEEELKIQRERERIKFERERIERERLELEQLRQVTAMSGSLPPASGARTQHAGYADDVDLSRRRSSGRSGAERVSSSSRHVGAYSGRDRRDAPRDDDIRARAHRADSDRERSRHGAMREAYDYGGSSATRDFDRHRRPTAPDAYARRVESSRAPPTYFSRGSSSSRIGGMDAGDMGGNTWSGSGAMTVPSAYAQSSSSREYGVAQSGGYGPSNPASSYANTEWTAASSAYGGGSHSAYGKPSYDKYDAYAANKYSSRRY